VYVIGLWDDPFDGPKPLPTAVVASKPDPAVPGDFRFQFTLSKTKFWQVGAVVVHNVEHPGLPAAEGDAVVLLGGGLDNQLRVAWLPLRRGNPPDPAAIRYFQGGSSWASAESDGVGVFALPPHYTSVSALWCAQVGQWVVTYSLANKVYPLDPKDPTPNVPAGPVVARFAPTPWGPWSREVEIFNPCRERAYGNFMHWSGMDDLHTRIAPSAAAWDDSPGFAYGAFMMERFTTFDPLTLDLRLAYLMSTSSPYQVQVMCTTVRLPPSARPVALSPAQMIVALASTNITFSVKESELLDWLSDPVDTPYPALARALLTLMGGRRLNQPVNIDVISADYEGCQPSPRNPDAVNMDTLRTAVLAASNENNGTGFATFSDLLV
jgi:hypothetical protein